MTTRRGLLAPDDEQARPAEAEVALGLGRAIARAEIKRRSTAAVASPLSPVQPRERYWCLGQ